MKTLKFTQIFLCLIFCSGLLGQNYSIMGDWEEKKQFDDDDYKINDIITSSYGYTLAVGEVYNPDNRSLDGFLMVGSDGDRPTFHIKKKFGGRDEDRFNGIVQNFDGSFTIVGSTQSASRGGSDGWIVQIDLDGNQLNTYKPGSQGNDELIAVAVNSQGNVLAAGHLDGQKRNDVWLVAIGPNGIDEVSVGRGEYGSVESITATQDDQFVVLGNTRKSNRLKKDDIWIAKLQPDGEKVWGPNFFGDKDYQEGKKIITCLDGGYAITGTTTSEGAGKGDVWLIRTNEYGQRSWQKTYGGIDNDIAQSIVELSTGGFGLFAQSWSFKAGARYPMMQLIVTDQNGKKIDEKYFGNEGRNNESYAMTTSFQDQIIVAGSINVQGKIQDSYISAFKFKPKSRPRRNISQDSDADGTGFTFKSSSSQFKTKNGNAVLEPNERGFLVMEVTNSSEHVIEKVSAKVEASPMLDGVDYWQTVQLGTFRANQTKKLVIPVTAKDQLASGSTALGIKFDEDGTFLGSASANIEAMQPNPAVLTIDYQFRPKNPDPNEPIELTVTLSNKGDQTAQGIAIEFDSPRGVSAIGSKTSKVNSLGPGQKQKLSYKFMYTKSFKEDIIDIQFKANAGSVSHTETIEVPRKGGGTIGPGAPREMMLWTSHDPEDGNAEFRTSNREENIKLKIVANKRLKKDRMQTLLNGKKVDGQKFGEEVIGRAKKDGNGALVQTYSNKIRLEKGKNVIQLVYEDEDGTYIESDKLVLDYIPEDAPNLYVLSIGVPHEDLKYTTKDAKDFAQLYRDLKGKSDHGFNDIQIIELTSAEATETLRIRGEFQKLKYLGNEIKESDMVVVFISSHGFRGQLGELRIQPSDYRSEVPEIYSINFKEDIQEKLNFLKCKKLVFLDACKSGNAIAAGGKDSYDKGASFVINSLINKSEGIEIFPSCGDDELSYEDDVWNNGAFTEAIIAAYTNKTVEIRGEMIKADKYSYANGRKEYGSDGAITIEELREFLSLYVPYMVKKVKKDLPNPKQNPPTKSTNDLDEDLGIYYITNN